MAPKKNLRSIIVLGALIGGLVVAVWIYNAVGKATGTLPFQTVLSRSATVKDEEWTMYTFGLTEDAEVKMSLNVTRGGGVTWYVMDQADQQTFLKAAGSGGMFVYTQDLSGKNKKSFTSGSVGMKAGNYVIAIKERSDKNILGSADTADVAVTILARPRNVR